MASGGDNPLADFYNAAALPYMIGPNKYSAFNNNPLQLQGYVGNPTNAQGQPIQPQPGTTLNSSPMAAPAAAPQQSQIPQFLPVGMGQGTGGAAGGENAQGSGQATAGQNVGGGYQINPAYAIQQAQQQYAAQQAPQAQPAQPAPTPGIMSRDQSLALLSNPGHVTTPGANVPQSAPAGQQPNVLDSFLQNNAQPSAPGAGGYSNAPFFKTLQGLRQGGSP